MNDIDPNLASCGPAERPVCELTSYAFQQMHFIVYCLDHPDIAERRQAVHDAHTAWLRGSPLRTLVSAPLTDLDGKANGSFFLYEDNVIGRVREFVAEAPFNKAGVWKTVDIQPFLKRVDNR